jgi:hypothetical protein
MRISLVSILIALILFAGATSQAQAWSAKCAMGLTKCILIQDVSVPVSEAESMEINCRNFTRNNIGRRVLRMSYKQILEVSGERISHPVLRASLAYDSLHDSALDFDRSLSIEQRYFPVKRACGYVFKAMRTSPPEEED